MQDHRTSYLRSFLKRGSVETCEHSDTGSVETHEHSDREGVAESIALPLSLFDSWNHQHYLKLVQFIW